MLRTYAKAAVIAGLTAAALLAAAAPAAAKGPDQVTITGPGLAKPIVVTGMGEAGSASALGRLSEGTGLFLAMFGPDQDGPGLHPTQPTAALGPKYLLEYRVPTQEPTPAIVKQDLYPYAVGGPVTYTAAGQPSMIGETRGGWYQTTEALRAVLVSLGLPDVSPTPSPAAGQVVAGASQQRSTSNSTPAFVVIGIVAAAVVAALVLIALRRRHSPRHG
jgi:hypothetical protein